MPTIIAIGGGNYEKGKTEKIDLELFRLAKAKRQSEAPKMLYFSTAGDNEPVGGENAKKYFNSLGFEVSVMHLIRDMPSQNKIEEAVFSADCIYIGGGDTIRLVHTMRSLGVDKMMWESAKKGTVLSGISAGCACWFDYTHTDAIGYYGIENTYVKFKCFGFIPAMCSVHYGTKRNADLRKRIANDESYPIVGLENGTAILWQDGVCRTLIQKTDRRVHVYYPSASGYKIVRPKESEEFELM